MSDGLAQLRRRTALRFARVALRDARASYEEATFSQGDPWWLFAAFRNVMRALHWREVARANRPVSTPDEWSDAHPRGDE